MSLESLNRVYAWPDSRPDVPPDGHCWFNERENGRVFNALMGNRDSQKRLYAEIGTWTGAGSTAWVIQNTNLDVICIDTWEGSTEHHDYEDYRRRLPTLYETFCVNLWGAQQRITPLRASSDDALDILVKHEVYPDFIYIDGSHEEEDVYNDISKTLKTFPDAVIFGDDFVNSSGVLTSIAAAVEKCYREGLFAPSDLQRIGRCWWLTRNT